MHWGHLCLGAWPQALDLFAPLVPLPDHGPQSIQRHVVRSIHGRGHKQRDSGTMLALRCRADSTRLWPGVRLSGMRETDPMLPQLPPLCPRPRQRMHGAPGGASDRQGQVQLLRMVRAHTESGPWGQIDRRGCAAKCGRGALQGRQMSRNGVYRRARSRASLGVQPDCDAVGARARKRKRRRECSAFLDRSRRQNAVTSVRFGAEERTRTSTGLPTNT